VNVERGSLSGKDSRNEGGKNWNSNRQNHPASLVVALKKLNAALRKRSCIPEDHVHDRRLNRARRLRSCAANNLWPGNPIVTSRVKGKIDRRGTLHSVNIRTLWARGLRRGLPTKRTKIHQ
jgi:hypothetical protein